MKAEVEIDKVEMKAVTVSDDIVHLNVGGQKVATKRSTLCQIEGSLLASMFSGRWEEGLELDEDGYVFFDFNPRYFGLILDYLRAKKIETPENRASIPKVGLEQLKNFNNLVRYLGLEEELKPKYVFKSHSAGINIEENGAVAVHEPHYGEGYVLSETIYEEEATRWQLKLESFEHSYFKIFVGIVKGDCVPSGDPPPHSHCWPGSYGWFLGGTCVEDINGRLLHCGIGYNALFAQGDIIELLLDCPASKLSLHLPDGEKFKIKLPSSTLWRLNIYLNGPKEKLRII